MPEEMDTGARCATPRHRRADALAVVAIALAAGAIAVNALFLQSGSHPAPIFVEKPKTPAARQVVIAPAVILPRPRPHPHPQEREVARLEIFNPAPTPVTASVTLPTPKADPIRAPRAPSQRVMTVQRVLTEFGYGQIAVTGHLDADTRQAIERFERQHKLPVTGELSERLTKKMTAMTGQSFE